MPCVTGAGGPVGIYDSGLGGLSVLREVWRRLPGVPLIYLGDTARVPYGDREPGEILQFSRENIAFLAAQGARWIVAGCNTSSAVAIPRLAAASPLPLVPLIDPAARALAGAGGISRIGVLATTATVHSGAYSRALRHYIPGAEVVEVAVPALVPLIEAGRWEGDRRTEAVLDEACGPLRVLGVEAAVLGCTHFSFVAAGIRDRLPGVRLFDPAAAAAAAVARRLAERARVGPPAPAGAGEPPRFFVTGDPHRFREAAERLLGTSLPPAVPVSLQSLAEHAKSFWRDRSNHVGVEGTTGRCNRPGRQQPGSDSLLAKAGRTDHGV